MDSKVEACAECTRSCLSLHKAKLNPYPIVSSFFKVMFGKQFSEELIVPPRFARTLKSLEGKKTFLEDSTGQKWDVHLSKVKGSLVFQFGWHEFSLDHGVEVGDFVIFHYITGSHFNVQIFTRSGCERPALFSEKNYQNKRSKATRDSVAIRGSDGTSKTKFIPKARPNSHTAAGLDVDRVQRQDNVRKSSPLAEDSPIEGSTRKRAKMVPKEDLHVEPYFLTSRSTSFSGEDDRDYLFDLSVFEMPAKKVYTEEKSIIKMNTSQQGITKSENGQIGTALVDVEKWQIAEMSPIAEISPLLVSSTLDSYIDEACLSREESILLFKSGSDIDMPSDSPTARMVKKEPQPFQNDNVYGVGHDSRNVLKDCLELCEVKDPAINNEDLGNLNDKVATDEGFLMKMVKREPVDFSNSTSAFMTKITCSDQQDGEPFLELPECLPIKMCRQGAKMDQKLIVLRDPAGKRWPVIYQEKKGVKILANGWKEFKKYNNIQPGDQCTFVLEKMEECIFKVEILRC